MKDNKIIICGGFHTYLRKKINDPKIWEYIDQLWVNYLEHAPHTDRDLGFYLRREIEYFRNKLQSAKTSDAQEFYSGALQVLHKLEEELETVI